MAADYFLDEALARLIKYGVVVEEDKSLRFSDEWAERLAKSVSYGMGAEQVKLAITDALRQYYREKGYDGELRFDLIWVKNLLLKQIDGEESKDLLVSFANGVRLLDE